MTVAGSVSQLAAMLPPDAVSIATADRLAASTDLWPLHMIRLHGGEAPQLPAAVVWPQSVEDLQNIVLHARSEGMTVVPYGAGSSVVGGATSAPGQVVVDFKRMSAVIAIDGSTRTATAQAGIIGELFERQLNRAGFTQGHFPSSIYCSTLGGWIAAHSAGQMSSRYGKIEDQVVGGTVVLGNGRVVQQRVNPLRSKEFDRLIGSEGILGMWAEATVRIHPLPQKRSFVGFDFPDLKRALEAARSWLYAGLRPSVVRIYDPLDSFLHRSHGDARRRDRGPNKLAWLGANLPRLASAIGNMLASRCRCILGFEGSAEVVDAELAAAIETASALLADNLGAEVGEAWYERRYAISYRQSNAFRAGVAVDTMEVACPWDRVEIVYNAVRKAGLRAGAQVLAHFSHVYLEGCSIYFTYAMPVRRGVDGYRGLWRNCLEAATAAGANVSHHHGSGQLKSLEVMRSLGGARTTLAVARRRADPDGIMNPEVLRGDKDRRPFSSIAQLPAEDAMVCVVAPYARLGVVENGLRQSGRTLGAAAELFTRWRVLNAARQQRLMRVNPQLGIIESLLFGVDGWVSDVKHRCVPAPRAAMGPDLTRDLLCHDVERLWLRCQPRLPVRKGFRAELRPTLRGLAAIARDARCDVARVCVTTRAGACTVRVDLAAGKRGAAVLEAVRGHLVGATEVESVAELGAIDDASFVFSGPWSAIQRFAIEAMDRGFEVAIPWSDPVGAVGIVSRSGGSVSLVGTESGARTARSHRWTPGDLDVMQRRAVDLGLSPRVEQRSPAPPVTGGAVPVADRPGPVPTQPLQLGAEVAQLDNCTYCPKLCRFSCPVAVADGSETLTPRQLMLTASLSRKGIVPLSPDVAARLWACVDCRGCRSFCDHGNDVAAVLQSARAELVAAGAAPEQIVSRLRSVDVPAAVDRPSASTWVFPSCQSDVDEVTVVAALATARFGEVHTMAAAGGCCGHPLWRWGDRAAFTVHARSFADRVAGAQRLVVDESGCAHAMAVLYSKVGVSMPEIVSATSLPRGPPVVEPADPWTLHHPCWSRSYLGEKPLSKWALGVDRLCAGSVLEADAGCCGGMLLPDYDPGLAQRVAHAMADDLMGGGAKVIYSPSPTCRRRLRSVGAPVQDALKLWVQP